MKVSIAIALFFLFMNASFSQNCSDVTLTSIEDPGPFEVGTMVEADGMRDGPDYKGASVYYPVNGEPPYPAIVIAPGYFSTQASVKDWGPFYASHGIIAMTIGTNSLFDYPDERAAGLLDAIETLRQENTRELSPIAGQIDTTNFAVSGWSMGGGGAQRAAANDSTLKAVVALCPWLSSSTTPEDLDHAVPLLIFSGEEDATAPPASHANVHYNFTPSSTDKLKYEVRNGNHSVANGPYGGGGSVGKLAIAWLRYFMEADPCYCDLLLETPNSASGYTTNVECSEIITAAEGNLQDDHAPAIYPNPATSVLQVEINSSRPVAFSLVSLLGEKVRGGFILNGRAEIDLRGLSPELYLLRINDKAHKVLKAF